ncbi:MAG: cryptochrome/photolyase family protein [Patescibacteria group bacterium]|nr:MAG: cryptochrome/photolyase family protein [Patescibacteria group bacterium]
MLILFPNQLYAKEFWPCEIQKIVLVEEPLFFHDPKTKILMHKQKLFLHRASMRAFADELRANPNLEVIYLEFAGLKDGEGLYRWLKEQAVKSINIFEPTDYLLERRLKRYAREYEITVTMHSSPNFMTSTEEGIALLRKMKKPFMTDFYKWKRLKTGILMERQSPVGGKWSFDTENRKSLPDELISMTAKMDLTEMSQQTVNAYLTEAKKYVDANFPNAIGDIKAIYPITRGEALVWLSDFLQCYLKNFGEYEDAILKDQSRLFHSVLSPIMNLGLIQPAEVVREAIDYAKMNNVPINSIEGFLRQIIGWREFMRLIYLEYGTKARNQNFFGAKRKLPKSFWTGTTGIVPVDRTIQKVLSTGYCHHIERLMILGNFMLLCEFDPNEVYRWFMEMFVDAYDWVMVPNVYGMSQFADGGIFATKPYISGSNYVLKMSNYTRDDWCEIWDGLYWRFVMKHQGYFAKNARTRVVAKLLEKMSEERRQHLKQRAERYLLQLEE